MMRSNITRSMLLTTLLAFAALAAFDAARAQTPRLRGIRFDVDTIESPRAWRGALTRVAGVVEFAAGRGRFSVIAIRPGPVVALNGITVAAPLAKPGDYYLFDSTGFILVRPAARTFSSFVFTRADFNQSGMLLPGAFLMKNTPIHTDTLDARHVTALRQHHPIAIHWHLDSLDERGPRNIYARGWLELQDAPAIEAGVARWFGVAAAIANRRGGVSALPRDKLQVTSVALLYPSSADRATYVRYLGLLTPLRLAGVELDSTRLVLPAGYRETRWPGFDHASGPRAPLHASATRWRTLSRK